MNLVVPHIVSSSKQFDPGKLSCGRYFLLLALHLTSSASHDQYDTS